MLAPWAARFLRGGGVAAGRSQRGARVGGFLLTSLLRQMTQLGEALRSLSSPLPEQPSLFAAISALTIDDGSAAEGVEHDERAPAEPTDTGYELALAPPPLPGVPPVDGVTVPRSARKTDVRRVNAARAREIARRSGLTHAIVNRQLNDWASIRTIGTATLTQLERRLRAADQWLARL